MAENINKKYTKKDFLTKTDFAKKYNIKPAFLNQAIGFLYRQHIHAKNNTGALVPVIVRLDARIHPLFHDIIIEQAKKFEKLSLQKQKG